MSCSYKKSSKKKISGWYLFLNIAELLHTLFTLICYSHTCTLGWAIGSDPTTSRMGYQPNHGRNLIILQLSESFSKTHFFKHIGLLLLEPVKLVIENYFSSSRTLLLRTELMISQVINYTWDVSLQSLLSCLVGQLFTSKSIVHH